MRVNAKKAVGLVNMLSDLMGTALEIHGREKVLPSRLTRLTKPGQEQAIFQLALLDDCLFALEAILFSTFDEIIVDADCAYEFLRPIARHYAKKDSDRYKNFLTLQVNDCEHFLQTHYNDTNFFGGANRFTKWSGFKIARALTNLLSKRQIKVLYSDLLREVVGPLMDWDFELPSDSELCGLLSEVENNRPQPGIRSEINRDIDQQTTMEDLGNDALLFDVVSSRENPTSFVLNKSHKYFKENHSFEVLFQSWAEMEIQAWDKRKQVIGDIRSDWGRIVRDMIDAEEL